MSDAPEVSVPVADGPAVLADGSAVASDAEPGLADTLPYRIVRPYRVRLEESTANETMRTAIYLA